MYETFTAVLHAPHRSTFTAAEERPAARVIERAASSQLKRDLQLDPLKSTFADGDLQLHSQEHFQSYREKIPCSLGDGSTFRPQATCSYNRRSNFA